MIAIKDDGSYRMRPDAYDLLERFGADKPLQNKYRSSYALLGWSGPGTLDALTQVTYDHMREYMRSNMHGVVHVFTVFFHQNSIIIRII